MRFATRYVSSAFLLGVLLTCLVQTEASLDPYVALRFFAFALVLLVVCFVLHFNSLRLQISVNALVVSYSGFILCSLLSVLWARNTAEGFFSSGRDLLGFLCFLFSAFLLKKDKHFFLRGLQVLGMCLALICIGVITWETISEKAFSYNQIYSVTGLNAHKNLAASFLFLNAGLLLLNVDPSPRWRKYLSLLLVFLSVLVMIFLRSKAVIVALFITCVVLWFSRKKKTETLTDKISLKRPIYTAFVVVLLVAVGLPFMIRFLFWFGGTEAGHNFLYLQVEERVQLWHKTNSMIAENWLTGVGSGNWQVFFPKETLSGMWRAEDLNFTFQRPHNDLLWVLSENGIIAFTFYILMFSFAVICGLQRNSQNRVAAAFLVGYLIIAFCDFPKERIEHLIFRIMF